MKAGTKVLWDCPWDNTEKEVLLVSIHLIEDADNKAMVGKRIFNIMVNWKGQNHFKAVNKEELKPIK